MKKYTLPEIEIKEFEKDNIVASGNGENQGSATHPSGLKTDGVSLGSVDYMEL